MPSIDFDLRQLEIFMNIVDLKSFSKAAKVVFLAQASVSERIATLEEMVGVRLLDRLGREVTPTKAGELLYKHAVLLLDMKKTACLEMQEFMGVKRGDIRLGRQHHSRRIYPSKNPRTFLPGSSDDLRQSVGG